nr:copper amine oxidase N-terminal domain-containing protein [Tumebacillus amylolyticus]
MVPIRTLLEGFGAQVFWDDGEQMVRVEYQGRTVVAWIGKTAYQVNGEAKTIDVAPVLLAQRTYVPLRLLVEAFGFDVAWDEPTETIDVKGLPVEVTP